MRPRIQHETRLLMELTRAKHDRDQLRAALEDIQLQATRITRGNTETKDFLIHDLETITAMTRAALDRSRTDTGVGCVEDCLDPLPHAQD